MTREEAIEVYNGLLNQKIIEAFEFFAPELKESEDERIRKFLINILSHGTWRKEWPFGPNEVVAYLEKQKEQKPVEDIIGNAISYYGAESLLDNANGLTEWEKFTAWIYCEFLRGLPKKLNQEYIKEQSKVILNYARKEFERMPNSTELIALWEEEKNILEEKDFRGDEWRLAYNAFLDGFAKGVMVKQKPVQTADEKEYIRIIKSLIADFIRDKKPEDVAYYQKIYDWLDGISSEQKPADLPAGFYVTLNGEKYYAKEMRCNGMNVKVVEPKPAEWSEEDEEMLNSIIRVVCGIGAQPSNGLREEQVRFLKSLRPHWKPSEEQMRTLDIVISDYRHACTKGSDRKAEILKSLLEQLQKM